MQAPNPRVNCQSRIRRLLYRIFYVILFSKWLLKTKARLIKIEERGTWQQTWGTLKASPWTTSLGGLDLDLERDLKIIHRGESWGWDFIFILKFIFVLLFLKGMFFKNNLLSELPLDNEQKWKEIDKNWALCLYCFKLKLQG